MLLSAYFLFFRVLITLALFIIIERLNKNKIRNFRAWNPTPLSRTEFGSFSMHIEQKFYLVTQITGAFTNLSEEFRADIKVTQDTYDNLEQKYKDFETKYDEIEKKYDEIDKKRFFLR